MIPGVRDGFDIDLPNLGLSPLDQLLGDWKREHKAFLQRLSARSTGLPCCGRFVRIASHRKWS